MVSCPSCEGPSPSRYDCCTAAKAKRTTNLSLWRSGPPRTFNAVLWIALISFPYVVIVLLLIYRRGLQTSAVDDHNSTLHKNIEQKLRVQGVVDKETHNSTLLEVLQAASTPDKTVILTAINFAWVQNNASMFELFLESFHRGDGTSSLLNHLVIIAMDRKAYERCTEIHPHCYELITEGLDFSAEKSLMNPDYKKLTWRRLDALKSVLDIGYSFLFSDADAIWFRNPFLHFASGIDIHISCDEFSGTSTDISGNTLNAGFSHVRANNRTVKLYDHLVTILKENPGFTDQSAINFFKSQVEFVKLGLEIRVLDTQIFADMCSLRSTDFANLTTMHATCCIGLEPKLQDLRIILEDYWTQQSINRTHTNGSSSLPRYAEACDRSWPFRSGN